MEAYPDIRSQLDLYLRGELDTNRMSEIKTLIDTDPAWYSTYHALLTESRGIRMTALQDLTSRLQSLEKTIAPQGDLSPSPSSISTTNETEDLENNYTPPAKGLEAEEPASSPLLIQGIRYTTLRDELRKLQDVEKGIKKNDSGGSGGGRVLRMRYWWAVAVGVVVMVVGGYFLSQHESRPKYVNQYLLDHFDEYVLHDKVRGSTDTTNKEEWDRDKEIGYDLYVLQEFEEAIPYLERRWERKRDTLALFYSVICHIVLENKEYYKNKKYLNDSLNKKLNKIKIL